MSTFDVSRSPVERRIITLQWVTLCWMLVECSVALISAWKARSISLLAFGSDSFVEIISAAVVVLQFNRRIYISPVRAAKFCGLLLYGLAVVISLVAVVGLSFRTEAATSPSGVAVTAGALLLMPVLAGLKRNAAARSGNRALRADAIQSATCAYLAALTLTGLLLRSAFGIRWLDQVVALTTVPILIIEARKAREGQVCGCC